MNKKNSLAALGLLLTSLQALSTQGNGAETTPLNQQSTKTLVIQLDHASSKTEEVSGIYHTKKPLCKTMITCCSVGCGKVCFNPLIIPCCVVGGFAYIYLIYFLTIKKLIQPS